MQYKIISGSIALVLGAAGAVPVANADDIFNNVSFYVGAHGGGLFGDGTMYDGVGGRFDTSDASLAVLGVLAGINVRQENWLFGVEGDVGFPVDGDIPNGACPGVNDLCEITINGHVRGRVGFSLGNVDLFVAGGLAIMGAKSNVLGSSESETLVGYSIGGGADVKVYENLLLRVELLHDSYGKHEFDQGYGVRNWHDFTARAAAIFEF